MDINQIRNFIEISKYKNFTTAAQYLHMNQSTLSRQIADLEREMNAILFVRKPRGIELTKAGDMFLEYGIEMLERYDKMRDKIANIGTGVTGKMTVGMPVNVFSHYTIFENFNVTDDYPDAEFKYTLMAPEELNNALVFGDIDVAFTYKFAIDEIKEEVAYKYIFSEPFTFFVSDKNELCGWERIIASDLTGRLFVILKTSLHPPFLRRIISNSVFVESNERVIQCSNHDNMFMSVASGNGIGVIPNAMFERAKNIYNVRKITVEDIDTNIEYVLAQNKKNTNPLINSFYKYCIRRNLF
ncbi:MAG: LysR family transcriptional regulator [Bacillota bacterium]|nr:LysR family transcriptional regulator [Bacillota bacterium]